MDAGDSCLLMSDVEEGVLIEMEFTLNFKQALLNVI